jgi:sarcosine oxidase, subunit beta
VNRARARRPSAGGAKTGEEIDGALREALSRPRYEVIPTSGADEWMNDLPQEANVAITCSPAQGIEGTLRLAERLAERGFRVVPHVSARLVADEAHLEDIVRRLGDVDVKEIFVIGGDAREPAGLYSSAFELLSTMATLGHSFEEIGVGGYPEGHPLIDDDTLRRALLDKQQLATYVISQMCFDPGLILDWVADIRRLGVSLPVLVGVPGVVNRKRLLQVSRKIGVGESARFLRKHASLARSLLADLLKSGGYSPDGLVRELAPHLGDRDNGVGGFHFYTFNQVESTEEWRRRILDHGAGDGAPSSKGAGGKLDRSGLPNGYRKPARYSAFDLVRHGLLGEDWPLAWRAYDLRPSYDVVIVGGGVHGLATAYYLAANHGITNVAVLEKGYIGSGGSGRNTAIIRSNYLTPEGVRFYDRSVKLYETLSEDLNFNAMFAQRGHLTLAHSDGALRTMCWRAEVNKLENVNSEVIGPEEIKRLVPYMDTSEDARYPILGALYHPPGGIIRHDAVVWGYARGVDALGPHIHQNTEVIGIDVADGRVRGVRTNRGDVATRVVVNCTAGWSTLISEMAGVRMPVSTFPLQAAVTEPVKPFLDPVIVSGTLHVYVSQTDRGELVFGASVDPFTSYSMRGSLEFTEGLAGHVLELMPSLSMMRVLRQWAGLCDMTPDFAPIMGTTPVAGFLLDVGWGTYGFKAGPVSGETMAALIATGKTPELIAPFGLDRFARGDLMGEKGAAAVGH